MVLQELEDRLYTSTEVANILGVSLRSVYRYLEDGKLDAEMKTATGRHRFTKQNILDFLSPQESNRVPAAKPEVKSVEAEAVVEEVPVAQVEAEEEVDWLAKFRAAAAKYKTEAETEEEVPAAPVRQSVSG